MSNIIKWRKTGLIPDDVLISKQEYIADCLELTARWMIDNGCGNEYLLSHIRNKSKLATRPFDVVAECCDYIFTYSAREGARNAFVALFNNPYAAEELYEIFDELYDKYKI